MPKNGKLNQSVRSWHSIRYEIKFNRFDMKSAMLLK